MLILYAGGDNDVGIIIGKYEPDQGSIQCFGVRTKTFVSGCRDIMGGIPVARNELLFGPNKPPAIVQLPASTQSCESSNHITGLYIFSWSMAVDRACMLKVLTTNQDGDVTSWYKIWEAANAVYFRCVHAGTQGMFRGLGESWVSPMAIEYSNSKQGKIIDFSLVSLGLCAERSRYLNIQKSSRFVL